MSQLKKVRNERLALLQGPKTRLIMEHMHSLPPLTFGSTYYVPDE